MGPVGTEMKNVILDFKSKAGGRQERKGGMETNIEHLLWGQIICHIMLPVIQWYSYYWPLQWRKSMLTKAKELNTSCTVKRDIGSNLSCPHVNLLKNMCLLRTLHLDKEKVKARTDSWEEESARRECWWMDSGHGKFWILSLYLLYLYPMAALFMKLHLANIWVPTTFHGLCYVLKDIKVKANQNKNKTVPALDKLTVYWWGQSLYSIENYMTDTPNTNVQGCGGK